MAEIIEVLNNYPGFAVKYDRALNPFFKAIVEENLGLIKKVPAGKALLSYIEKANPSHLADFPPKVKIMVEPVILSYVQSGQKLGFVQGSGSVTARTLVPSPLDPRHNPTMPGPRKDERINCNFYILGGSFNKAKDSTASTNAGAGSVCTMYFTNAQMKTSKGERAYSHIVLAHELIHSYHCLYGIKIDGPDEELWTSGLGKYSNEPLSENTFRSQFNLPLRQEYY